MFLISNIRKTLNDPKKQILFFSFSFIFSLITSLAESVYIENKVAVHLKIVPFFMMYIFLNVAYGLITYPYKYEVARFSFKIWRFFFFTLLFSYILCWLIFWPGIISHDDMYILLSGLKRAEHFPPLYTAFLIFFKQIGLSLGSLSYGLFFYVAFQIVVVSAVFSTILTGIVKANIPKILKYATVSYYIFTPLFACFAISIIKDTLFSIALTMMTLFIYTITKQNSPQKKDWIFFWLSIFFIEAFRSNGIYIVTGVVAAFYFLLKKHTERIHTASIIILMTFLLSSSILYFQNLIPLYQEKFSIPLQQIAAVVKNDGVLTKKQKNFISQIAPLENIKDKYSPYTVDPLKWENPEFDTIFLNMNPYVFLKNWLQIMPDNLTIYTKAYLQITYGFWAPKQYKQRIGTNDVWNHNRKSLLFFAQRNDLIDRPVIRGKIGKLLKEYYSYHSLFFQNGILFWMIFVCAFLYYLKKRSLKPLIIYLPCFILWMTLMVATPAMHIFRYVFCFACLLPFFIALLFTDDIDFSN